MHAIVADKLPLVSEICRKRHVARLELFGSAVDGRFDPARSDLDFLVDFLPSGGGGLGGDYFSLKADLETLFGREVNLVVKSAIRNRYFRAEVEETGVELYAAAKSELREAGCQAPVCNARDQCT
jgi:hypothetical protein